MSMVITNYSGISKRVHWTEEAMSPFETRTIYPCQQFPDLVEFLDGKEGTCSIDYELNKSFTRLLLGWESPDKSQLQVTHSKCHYIGSRIVMRYTILPREQKTCACTNLV